MTAVSWPVLADAQERARDGVVHVEKTLVRDLPDVARLCDSIKGLKQRRVNVGGCEVYCEVEGDGVPLVLINGGPGATHHGFHPAFSRAGDFAKVVYYDQRGCGQSDSKPGEGYSVDQAVDDLERLREALKIDKWVVLGHSYGGVLAQSYAIKYPERPAGLVLVGSSTAMQVALQPGREGQFLSKEESARIAEINNTPGLSTAQRVYNNFLNGDWKRQHYTKPSGEELARIALYEWKPAPGFRDAIISSLNNVDLEGAFEACPIPTLIIEGEWDLTWNTDKAGKLAKNHPRGRLVMFAESAHSPFKDEPERFFGLLRDFTRNLPEVSATDLKSWKDRLAQREQRRKQSPAHIVRSALGKYGRQGSEQIVQAYSDEWLKELHDSNLLVQTGMALYDCERYEKALEVFRRAGEAVGQSDKHGLAVALIWQGHMLDLLGRRDEAIAVYERVVRMDISSRGSPVRNDQYGLAYYPTSYALQRTKVPFTRLENIWEELITEMKRQREQKQERP
jgi:proline iminopeptidase